MNYLGMCVIAKDETPFLEEWINYHQKIGYQHFYIYDNESAIPIKDTLSKYIEDGLCTVIDFPGKSMQMPAFNHCLMNFGADNQWISFFDVDEFVVPIQDKSMQDLLKKFENYGGLNINWRIFGSNSHIKRPEGLVTENYLMATPDDYVENLHTKATVQPRYAVGAGSNPHHFLFKPGYNAVSEKFEVVPNAWTKSFSGQMAQLNHYANKSLEDFKFKISRGRSDGAHLAPRDLVSFEEYDRNCTVEDKKILKFI